MLAASSVPPSSRRTSKLCCAGTANEAVSACTHEANGSVGTSGRACANACKHSPRRAWVQGAWVHARKRMGAGRQRQGAHPFYQQVFHPSSQVEDHLRQENKNDLMGDEAQARVRESTQDKGGRSPHFPGSQSASMLQRYNGVDTWDMDCTVLGVHRVPTRHRCACAGELTDRCRGIWQAA